MPQGVLFFGTLLPVVAIPLGLFMLRIAQDARKNTLIRRAIEDQLTQVQDRSLTGFDTNRGPRNDRGVVATIHSPRGLTYEEALRLQRDIATQLQETIALKHLVIPVTRLDPLFPPTPIPTRPPGAKAFPTMTLVLSSTTQPSPIRSATETPSPTLVSTSTSTTTPTATVRSTLTSTLIPLSRDVIGGTNHQGVNLRLAPGLTSVVAGIPDGVLIQGTGPEAIVGGQLWVEVVVPDSRVR